MEKVMDATETKPTRETGKYLIKHNGNLEIAYYDQKNDELTVETGDCKGGDDCEIEFVENPQNQPRIVYDGHGNEWSKTCPICLKETMQVVRPGTAICQNCRDNDEKLANNGMSDK